MKGAETGSRRDVAGRPAEARHVVAWHVYRVILDDGTEVQYRIPPAHDLHPGDELSRGIGGWLWQNAVVTDVVRHPRPPETTGIALAALRKRRRGSVA
jgi:hypothetical protein